MENSWTEPVYVKPSEHGYGIEEDVHQTCRPMKYHWLTCLRDRISSNNLGKLRLCELN